MSKHLCQKVFRISYTLSDFDKEYQKLSQKLEFCGCLAEAYLFGTLLK
jgi:hypothetical protein